MFQAPLPLDFSQCQRWRHGRERWRPAGEVFNPSYASVQRIDTATAKAFVQEHHYSHSFPASRVNAGLFVKKPFQKEILAGCATFSVPMTQAVVPALLDGLHPSQGVELGRFVLLDEVEANGETWTLARAFKVLREALPAIRGVVSYCDPEPRYSKTGDLVKKGHVGTIYRAHNATLAAAPSPGHCSSPPMGRWPTNALYPSCAMVSPARTTWRSCCARWGLRHVA